MERLVNVIEVTKELYIIKVENSQALEIFGIEDNIQTKGYLEYIKNLKENEPIKIKYLLNYIDIVISSNGIEISFCCVFKWTFKF